MKCEVCDIVCSSLFYLSSHLCKHLDELPYICSSCTVNNISHDQRITFSHHFAHLFKPNSSSKDLNFCNLCLKTFSNFTSLILHFYDHFKTVYYTCKTCSLVFTNKEISNFHFHLNSPMTCQVCGSKTLNWQFMSLCIIKTDTSKMFVDSCSLRGKSSFSTCWTAFKLKKYKQVSLNNTNTALKVSKLVNEIVVLDDSGWTKKGLHSYEKSKTCGTLDCPTNENALPCKREKTLHNVDNIEGLRSLGEMQFHNDRSGKVKKALSNSNNQNKKTVETEIHTEKEALNSVHDIYPFIDNPDLFTLYSCPEVSERVNSLSVNNVTMVKEVFLPSSSAKSLSKKAEPILIQLEQENVCKSTSQQKCKTSIASSSKKPPKSLSQKAEPIIINLEQQIYCKSTNQGKLKNFSSSRAKIKTPLEKVEPILIHLEQENDGKSTDQPKYNTPIVFLSEAKTKTSSSHTEPLLINLKQQNDIKKIDKQKLKTSIISSKMETSYCKAEPVSKQKKIPNIMQNYSNSSVQHMSKTPTVSSSKPKALSSQVKLISVPLKLHDDHNSSIYQECEILSGPLLKPKAALGKAELKLNTVEIQHSINSNIDQQSKAPVCSTKPKAFSEKTKPILLQRSNHSAVKSLSKTLLDTADKPTQSVIKFNNISDLRLEIVKSNNKDLNHRIEMYKSSINDSRLKKQNSNIKSNHCKLQNLKSKYASILKEDRKKASIQKTFNILNRQKMKKSARVCKGKRETVPPIIGVKDSKLQVENFKQIIASIKQNKELQVSTIGNSKQCKNNSTAETLSNSRCSKVGKNDPKQNQINNSVHSRNPDNSYASYVHQLVKAKLSKVHCNEASGKSSNLQLSHQSAENSYKTNLNSKTKNSNLKIKNLSTDPTTYVIKYSNKSVVNDVLVNVGHNSLKSVSKHDIITKPCSVVVEKMPDVVLQDFLKNETFSDLSNTLKLKLTSSLTPSKKRKISVPDETVDSCIKTSKCPKSNDVVTESSTFSKEKSFVNIKNPTNLLINFDSTNVNKIHNRFSSPVSDQQMKKVKYINSFHDSSESTQMCENILNRELNNSIDKNKKIKQKTKERSNLPHYSVSNSSVFKADNGAFDEKFKKNIPNKIKNTEKLKPSISIPIRFSPIFCDKQIEKVKHLNRFHHGKKSRTKNGRNIKNKKSKQKTEEGKNLSQYNASNVSLCNNGNSFDEKSRKSVLKTMKKPNFSKSLSDRFSPIFSGQQIENVKHYSSSNDNSETSRLCESVQNQELDNSISKNRNRKNKTNKRSNLLPPTVPNSSVSKKLDQTRKKKVSSKIKHTEDHKVSKPHSSNKATSFAAEAEKSFAVMDTKARLEFLNCQITLMKKMLLECSMAIGQSNSVAKELRVVLYKLPEDIFKKHVKHKPIMLSSILPTITKVISLQGKA